MPFEIVRNDITMMTVDVIVNASNSKLQQGGGVSGAIFSAAGAEPLQAACDQIGVCGVGQAVITDGFALPARHIIHTVGPVWQDGSHHEAQLLYDCYINSMNLALKHQCTSIAFPLIASGIYGYPKADALQIAISAIGHFLLEHDMTVYLVVYDKSAFALSEKLFSAIERYIDDNYVEEHRFARSNMNMEAIEVSHMNETTFEFTKSDSYAVEPSTQIKRKRKLEDVVAQLDESFPQMLLRLIDEKGLTDVETYKRANIDRKLFSKIRSDKGYNPSKVTAIAFAIALELNLDEVKDLLGKSGYTLSHSSKFDVIIRFFIEESNFNIFEINEALFAFDQTLLGA
jgi:O-acetyl-ADP-ribose deacetylase (regulator of RNase III)